MFAFWGALWGLLRWQVLEQSRNTSDLFSEAAFANGVCPGLGDAITGGPWPVPTQENLRCGPALASNAAGSRSSLS